MHLCVSSLSWSIKVVVIDAPFVSSRGDHDRKLRRVWLDVHRVDVCRKRSRHRKSRMQARLVIFTTRDGNKN
jgi:hypothetical protein